MAGLAGDEADESPAGLDRVVARPLPSRPLPSEGPDGPVLDAAGPARKVGLCAQGGEGGARANAVPFLSINGAHVGQAVGAAARHDGVVVAPSGARGLVHGARPFPARLADQATRRTVDVYGSVRVPLAQPRK